MANRNGLLFNSADGYWVLRVVVLVLGQEIEILNRERIRVLQRLLGRLPIKFND